MEAGQERRSWGGWTWQGGAQQWDEGREALDSEGIVGTWQSLRESRGCGGLGLQRQQLPLPAGDCTHCSPVCLLWPG